MQFLIIGTFALAVYVTESKQSVHLHQILPYGQLLFSSLVCCKAFLLPSTKSGKRKMPKGLKQSRN